MEGGVPRPLGKPLIELMTQFELDAQKLYRDHTGVLDNIHNVLADDKEFLILTLEEVARKALGLNPDSLAGSDRYAIHKALSRQSFYIIPNQAISATESYTIRPKEQSKIIDTVVQWVREYQDHRSNLSVGRTVKNTENHPLEKFVRKARRLILRSRRIRSPTTAHALGPTAKKLCPGETEDGMVYSKVPVESFSDTDRLILDYLRFWVLPPLVMRAGMLKTAGSVILRSTGMYRELPLTPATGYLFLQELGVFTPWENIHILSEQLSLPGHGISATSDRITEESNRLCDQLDSESFEDTMKDLRKDWGNLPVFCVDHVGAAEIDDGFSLEHIPGLEDEFWIHVHVANPSAFVPPDHPLGRHAAYHKRTFYSPERTYPMFPVALTRTRFSLASDRPTLTFSAKVNMDGAILETNVRNGYIRNVIFITPDRLRKLFGLDRDLIPSMTLTVGGTMPKHVRAEIQDHIDDDHQSLLHTIRRLLSARRELRIKKGAMESAHPERSQPLVSVGSKSIAPFSAQLQQAHHYVGDPVIQLTGFIVDPFEPVDSTRHDLVSHVMLLAGEIAAQWCKDRGIPLVFTGTVYHPEYPRVTSENLGHERDALFHLGLPKGLTSSKPIFHASLGMDQYTKCTSPLRRFSDLLGHWQIEAALRHEAEQGAPSSAASHVPVLPFSVTDIDTIIARSDWQNLRKDRAQSRSRDFWACQLLFRALYFDAVELPETFQCMIVGQTIERKAPTIQKDDHQYIGSLLPFGLRCLVTVENEIENVELGDLVEVKLSYVELYYISVVVRLVRLIKRSPNGLFAAKGFLI
jgi:exoribonuclease R